MSESQDDRPGVLRFGPFHLNVRTGELWSAERQVRLHDRPLQVLTLLLERAGDVVTRDELRARVWHGTVVDFDLGLNAAVNRLREVLDDEAESPRFIETLPRRGYRFIAPVEPDDPRAQSEDDEPPPFRRHVVYASPDMATREAPGRRSTGQRPGSVSSSSAEWEDVPLPSDTTRYTLLEKIGSGGMGEVFRARDSRLGREVAIKFLPVWLAEDSKALRRFHREAQSAAALNHPNILDVHDLAVVDGRPCIVTELLDGRTLRKRLNAGPLPVQEVFSFAAQILSGLAAAHARGIVHRDLKPENLFITSDGRVKILDFGIVKVASSAAAPRATTTATLPGVIMGSAGYMSPEQVQGLAVDHRSDIFSFGTVLYEMSTGTRPFSGNTETALISSVIKDTPAPVSSLNASMPPELSQLTSRCLEKNPSQRYQTVAELRDDLLRLAPHFDALLMNGERRRRRRVGFLVIACVALAAGVLAAVAWNWRWPASTPRGAAGSHANFPLFSSSSQLTAAPGWETDPALSPDGSLVAYTSNESGDADVWVMPSGGGAAVNVSKNPATDGKPAWFPDKSEVAFESDRGGRLNVWRAPALGGGASLLVPDARDPAISPDGRWIAFVRQDGTGTGRVMVAPISDVSAARIVTDKPERLGESEEDPAWSGDGKFLCYSAYRSLWIVPVSGGRPRPLTMDGEVDIEPVWSPDNRSIYFSSTRAGAWVLWSISVDGGRPERVTGGAGSERHPTISRDGSRVAFSNFEEDSDVILHDLASGREQRTGSTREESGPALSPDGRVLVYARSAGIRAGTELYTEPLVNGQPSRQPSRLSNQAGAVSQPSFSPDGKWIVYQRSLEGNRDVWTIPSGGGQPVRITDDPADDMNPVWSPDGTEVAFASTRGGAGHIWAVPVKDGQVAGAVRQITRETNMQECPAWSPDARQIAFVGHTADGLEAFVAPANGKGPAQKVTTGANAGWLRWDPTGRGLIVAGTWGAGTLSLRIVNTRTKAISDFTPPVVIGPSAALSMFDISVDGRTVVFSRPFWSGDLWIAEVRR